MIIECNNCNKKFEVDSSLIPNEGRKIQCGSCNYSWFYEPEINNNTIFTSPANNNDLTEEVNRGKETSIYHEKESDQNQEIGQIIVKRDAIKGSFKNVKIDRQTDNKITINKVIIKFSSYLIVGIFTFISLIIILDTFQSPLSNLIPELELLLFNFFETIKDLTLFFKNLIE